MSGSGISWAICKSAPRSRQITMPALHHSDFYRPDENNQLTLSMALLPTRHKTGHFGDVLPSQSLDSVLKTFYSQQLLQLGCWMATTQLCVLPSKERPTTTPVTYYSKIRQQAKLLQSTILRIYQTALVIMWTVRATIDGRDFSAAANSV